ncbi:hypothetical protein ACFVUY_43295, partial [Kitasatospora sp. NPDC058063]|uniref:hypothetical protein n=1 Tax=unclassified Kitasatospora TaxID=2633591 RepID=UPI0036DC0F9D
MRPSFTWQVARASTNIRAVLTKIRDPEGFAQLEAMVSPSVWSSHVGMNAKNDLVKILVTKGGTLADHPQRASPPPAT